MNLYDAAEQQVQNEKREAFARLSAADPAQAKFLADTAAVFGKPDVVEITYLDGSTFRSGTFKRAEDYPDCMARRQAQHDAWLADARQERILRERRR
jgi:hypothetical protein